MLSQLCSQISETRPSTIRDEPVLVLDDLTVRTPEGRALVDDVSLTVRAGEVVGLAGVEGNGQAELVEALLGMRRADAGQVVLGGEDITRWSTRRRREGGVAYVPEDRHRHGLLLDAPLWENRVLGHQTEAGLARGVLVDRAAARRDTERIVEEYDVRTPGIDVLASALSGGNQQKLIVGREITGLSAISGRKPAR